MIVLFNIIFNFVEATAEKPFLSHEKEINTKKNENSRAALRGSGFVFFSLSLMFQFV